jgi:hypothetical protein
MTNYRTARAAHDEWRNTGWLRAFAYLVKRGGGPVENRELAAALGYDPRGLRALMQQREEFIIEIRNTSGEGSRGFPYYRLNPACIEAAPEPKHPAILTTLEGQPRLTSRDSSIDA